MAIINIFDCETTGKLHPDHRIIEASFRLCDLESATELENHLFRFNPERNIEARAVQVHKITNEDVKKEPTFKDQIHLIKPILEKTDILVAHNLIGFDLIFIKQEFERCGEELPDFKLFDTMTEANFSTDLGKSPTLFELCWSLDVAYDPIRAHSGDYDTEVLRDAFFNALRLGWFTIDRS